MQFPSGQNLIHAKKMDVIWLQNGKDLNQITLKRKLFITPDCVTHVTMREIFKFEKLRYVVCEVLSFDFFE